MHSNTFIMDIYKGFKESVIFVMRPVHQYSIFIEHTRVCPVFQINYKSMNTLCLNKRRERMLCVFVCMRKEISVCVVCVSVVCVCGGGWGPLTFFKRGISLRQKKERRRGFGRPSHTESTHCSVCVCVPWFH